MLVSPTLLTAAIIAIVGTLILWSNPVRNVNRAIFTCTLHLAGWLTCLHLAFTMTPGLPWLRLTCAVGTWLPMHFWIVKETIVTPPGAYRRGWVKRHLPWFAICLALAVVCFTDAFIPAHSTPERRLYGWGYYAYIASNLGLYAFLLRDAFVDTRTLTGGRRLELQVWLLGGCATAATILALMTLSAATRGFSTRLQPFAVLVFYSATIYAITTHRIFDARQLFRAGLGKATLVTVVASVAWVLHRGFATVLPGAPALLFTTAIALLVASVVNFWLGRILKFYPQATEARLAAFEVARREARPDQLEKAFLRVLTGWGQTEHALLLAGAKDILSGGGGEVPMDTAAVQALCHLRWATPERLARERSTPERAELAEFMEQRNLGAVVISDGPTLTALVGVGVPASRRPFTYPQVTQLQELGSIIESAMERAHFSVKAQHAEQLATVGLMGAGLAHEIRNPLVTIKTFVQLLPKHHADPVFREKFFGLIGDEVTRIDHLTEQLLDLASPRAYHPLDLELHPVLRSGMELVAGKATDKRIEFRTEFRASPDRVLADAAAVKQVLLNLCLNAIQALERQPTERWVKISTRNLGTKIEMTVTDSGPGIAPGIRPRLFQPFQSTKSSGFGLGLAICNDILARLDTTIAVDPTEPGCGATFRVVFPCPA